MSEVVRRGGGRIEWLDSARGIAIILVVLGHCIGYIDDPLNKVILSFHMPTFFFLSGICMKREESWKAFAKKRFQRMVGWQILLAGICMGYDFIQSHSINSVSNLFVWFLPVLFCSEIVFQILCKVVSVNLKTCVLLVLISGLLQLLPVHTVIHIEIVPTAVLFLALGYSFKNLLAENHNLIEQIGKYGVVALPFVVLLAEINQPVMMYNNDYGNYALFIRNRQISRRIKKHLWLSNRSWARDVHSFGILHSWGALAGKSCSAQASSIWLIAGAFRRTQSK